MAFSKNDSSFISSTNLVKRQKSHIEELINIKLHLI